MLLFLTIQIERMVSTHEVKSGKMNRRKERDPWNVSRCKQEVGLSQAFYHSSVFIITWGVAASPPATRISTRWPLQESWPLGLNAPMVPRQIHPWAASSFRSTDFQRQNDNSLDISRVSQVRHEFAYAGLEVQALFGTQGSFSPKQGRCASLRWSDGNLIVSRIESPSGSFALRKVSFHDCCQ